MNDKDTVGKFFFVLDTNIVLKKIFYDMNINGRVIWNHEKSVVLAKEEIDKITNSGDILIITPTVVKEVAKLWKAVFDHTVYRKHFEDVQYSDVKHFIKKRMSYLLEKYSYSKYFPNLEISERNTREIKSVYGLVEDKVKLITDIKLRGLPPAVRESKLSHREKGLMPEESDIAILAECMYMRQNLPEGFVGVKLFTCDKDFTYFPDEIRTFLFVEIYTLNI